MEGASVQVWADGLKGQLSEMEALHEKLDQELRAKHKVARELDARMAADRSSHARLMQESRSELKQLGRRIARQQRFVSAQRRGLRGKVVLNVGGTKFTTSLATLGDSVLAALFYGHTDDDEDSFDDGAVFIDRDPVAFADILRWLRTGVVPRTKDGAQLLALLHEAAYYGLDELVEALEALHRGHRELAEHKDEDGRCGWIQVSQAQFLDLVNRPAPSGLRLNGSDLRGFDLSRMDLRKANFTRCNLTGADLSRALLDEACLVECCLREAKLAGAHLHGADLTRADCRRADFTEAGLKGAVLRDARLEGTILCRERVVAAELDSDDL